MSRVLAVLVALCALLSPSWAQAQGRLNARVAARALLGVEPSTGSHVGSCEFLQRDPSGFVDSVNVYAALANDPINNRDPTGEQTRGVCTATSQPRPLHWRLPGGEPATGTLDPCEYVGPTMRESTADEVLEAREQSKAALDEFEAGRRDAQRKAQQGYLAYREYVQQYGTAEQKQTVRNIDNATMLVGTAVTAGLNARFAALTADAELAFQARLVTELSRAQSRNIRTINNIITNNAQVKDFTGVAIERAGLSLPKSATANWNHVQEMRQSVDGLRKATRGLEGSLQNPNLSPHLRAAIEESLLRARFTLQRMERALGGN